MSERPEAAADGSRRAGDPVGCPLVLGGGSRYPHWVRPWPVIWVMLASLAIGASPACIFDPLPADAFDLDAGVGPGSTDAAASDASRAEDASGAADAGTPEDAATGLDAGAVDAAPPVDATVDAGEVPDAGETCGNGRVEGGEACDDTNLMDGDGCDGLCQVEGWWRCANEPSDCVQLPDLSVDDVRVLEGDTAFFTVRLSKPAPFDVQFHWSTSDLTANAPGDYQSVTGDIVTMAQGVDEATLAVTTVADAVQEPTESFRVELSAVREARPVDPLADATLEDLVVSLVDRGLISRYYLDDAGPMQAVPQTVADAAANPLPLGLIQDFGDEPTFFEEATGRGLEWSQAGRRGRVQVDIDNTKVRTRLDGSQTGTIEVVALVSGTVNASRLLHIGGEELGKFSLLIASTDIYLAYNDDELIGWPVPANLFGRRAVYTLVYDSAVAAQDQRVRLYIDGADLGATTNGPDRFDGLSIPQGRQLMIGNRRVTGPGGGFSVGGRIYYGAVYDSALSPSEVRQNATVLTGRDDP